MTSIGPALTYTGGHMKKINADVWRPIVFFWAIAMGAALGLMSKDIAENRTAINALVPTWGYCTDETLPVRLEDQ